jgi:outer membrane lipase/esterase
MLRALLSLSFCGLTTIAVAQDRTFTSQYSFGDSLSDSGNLFALARQPPAPYVNGRFSNGPVFVELLGQTLVPAAAVSAIGPNRNFAFGGANAASSGAVPNLAQQVASYRQQGLPARSTDLFTVLAGANDLIGVLSSPTTPTNPANLDAAGTAVAQAVATNVQTLVGLGAKNILVGGLPNLGATPRALAQGGAGGPGATFGLRATTAFNNELKSRLQALAAASPDVNFVYLDLHGVLDRLAADFRDFGYNNASSFVLAPVAQGGGGDPSGYVFFDDIHPTARTHALIANIVLEQLNPERPLGFAATQATAALALTGIAAGTIDARARQLTYSNRPIGQMDVYATFNYADGVRGTEGRRERFDYDGYVVTAGTDWRISEGTFAGLAVNGGKLEAAARNGSFVVDDGAGRIYGVWRGGPVSLLLDGAYGVLRVKDIRRTTAFGGLSTRGKTSGTHWGGGIKAQWNVEMGAASVRPWFGLRTERVTLDGYTERDVPALAMEFAEQEAKSSSGAVGVDLSLMSQLGPRTARLDLRAAWHGELGSRTRDVAGRLADNFTRPTAIAVEDGDGDGLEVGGAATLFFSKNWGATVGYTADIRSGDRVAHKGTVSVQTGF